MFDILIKNAHLDSAVLDIGIKDGVIKSIKQNIEEPAKETINAKDKILMSAFCNMHTHAAMSLFKRYRSRISPSGLASKSYMAFRIKICIKRICKRWYTVGCCKDDKRRHYIFS